MRSPLRIGILLLHVLLVACAPRSAAGSGPVLVAHRGASEVAPENTIAAIDRAWALGADAVEADVHLTRDGVIVAHHDATTAKTAGVDRRVDEQSLAELRALDFGAWKGASWTGEPIPTLDEILARVPAGKRVLIEIKCDERIVPDLRASVRRSGLGPEQVAVICFDEAVIERVKQTMPETTVLWLSSFEEERPGIWTPTGDEVVATALRIGADGVDVHANPEVVDEVFVAGLRRAGLEFHVWTVNDPALATRMLELGADSVTTDRPGWLREQLDDHR